MHGPARSVVIPFIIFTAIWGSTWIVIRGQLGAVPPQWSVTYRFAIAAVAMARCRQAGKGDNLHLGRKGLLAASFLGFCQFCVNFNAVYLAERHITSGVVATVFALLLIPATLLGWAVARAPADAGASPGARWWRSRDRPAVRARASRASADSRQIAAGIGLTLVGMLGAAIANVAQARPQVRSFPLFPLLAWSMAAGAIIDALIAFAMTGPPVFDPRPSYWVGVLYLALVRLGADLQPLLSGRPPDRPGKAAYSSVLVPIIAMGFSTWLEDYRWTPPAVAGALLALGGMAAALSRSRSKSRLPTPPEAL